MNVFYKVEAGQTFHGKKVLHSPQGREQQQQRRCAVRPDKTVLVVSAAPRAATLAQGTEE